MFLVTKQSYYTFYYFAKNEEVFWETIKKSDPLCPTGSEKLYF